MEEYCCTRAWRDRPARAPRADRPQPRRANYPEGCEVPKRLHRAVEQVQPRRTGGAHAASAAFAVLGTIGRIRQAVRKALVIIGCHHAAANPGIGSFAASSLVERGRRWRDTQPRGDLHRAVWRKTPP